MLSILLDTFINRILGHSSMSEKLRSAHPVLLAPSPDYESCESVSCEKKSTAKGKSRLIKQPQL